MAITNGYITQAELESYLGIGDDLDDDELDAAINAASRAIDGHCQRRFYDDGSATARTYRPLNKTVVYTDDFSTTSGLVVATDTTDDGTADTTWASSDYELEPANGESGGISGFPYNRIRAVEAKEFATTGERRSVSVTARWGWAAVPDAVKQACFILAADLFKLKEAPHGIAGFADLGIIRVRDNPKVAMLLAPYTKAPLVS